MFKVGEKVRVRWFEKRPEHWNQLGAMDKWMGKIVTIESINEDKYKIKEDSYIGGWSWRENDFEKLEESDMKKSELKNGMICTARNGNKYMYLMGELRRFDSWCSGMKEDLKNDEYESLDIVAVHNPIGCTINEMLNHDYSTEKPIWKHEEPKEMTIAEIEEALGYPIKVIGK